MHFLLICMTLCLLSPRLVAESLSDVVQNVGSSVVVIKTVQKDATVPIGYRDVMHGGLGSGVLISDDGKIMTAAHVVQTADSVTVEFKDGQKIGARVVASSNFADVALLQLDSIPDNIKRAKLGDSDLVQVGDKIFVMGAPYGVSHSLTVGYISARRSPKNRLGSLQKLEMFQTDAAINKGNSGGPMFNMDGDVIGIVSSILSASGGFEGMGFAVTANVAKRMLLEEQSFWSGMIVYMLKDEAAKVFNLPQSTGLLVQRVAKNSPAKSLGLRGGHLKTRIQNEEFFTGGDIILKANNIKISGDADNMHKIISSINRLKKGDPLNLEVLRAGKVMKLGTFLN